MIQIAISTRDAVQTRFAISPMLTTVLAIHAALHPTRTQTSEQWRDVVQRRLADTALPTLGLLMPFNHYVADFLFPFPETSHPRFADELESMANTPISTIEAAMARQQNPMSADKLRTIREQLVNDLAVFWERVMQPDWPLMQSIMEGDLMHHSRDLMFGGAARMFASLDNHIQLSTPDLLSVCTKTHLDDPVDTRGLGIVLVPNVIANCDIWIQLSSDRPPMISYRAYGAGLWSHQRSQPSEAASILFGENRSRLLHELTVPMSTKDLASRLDLTPGAVSQQLGQLKDAGLVNASRAGRAVYYSLNQRGEQLMDLLHHS